MKRLIGALLLVALCANVALAMVYGQNHAGISATADTTAEFYWFAISNEGANDISFRFFYDGTLGGSNIPLPAGKSWSHTLRKKASGYRLIITAPTTIITSYEM